MSKMWKSESNPSNNLIFLQNKMLITPNKFGLVC